VNIPWCTAECAVVLYTSLCYVAEMTPEVAAEYVLQWRTRAGVEKDWAGGLLLQGG